MKIKKSQLKQIILEEMQNILTDEEYEILDIGPSHPQYHRVVRKAERLGGSAAGPGTGRKLSSYTRQDRDGAYFRREAHEQFLKMIEKERGAAAISEPMIALGMNPTDSEDRRTYTGAYKCGLSLSSHLDKIIELEQDLIYKDLQNSLSGQRSDHDVTGRLEKKCYSEATSTSQASYKDNSLECITYRLRRDGKLGQTPYGAEHLYDRKRLYDRIVGGGSLQQARELGKECSKFDPTFLKKVLEVQVDKLRPMPAYTPEESELQLKNREVEINETFNYRNKKMKITKQLLKQILKEEMSNIDEALPMFATASKQRAQLEKIYKFLEMQMQNKSLGFNPDVTKRVVDQLVELVNNIDMGTGRDPQLPEEFPAGVILRQPKDGNE